MIGYPQTVILKERAEGILEGMANVADGKYEVVGHIPILKILREGLQDAKRKTESAPTDSD